MNPNEFEKKRPAAYEMGLLTFERNVRAQRRTHPTYQPLIVNAIVQDRPAISQSCADKFIKTPAAQREAIRLLPRENIPHGGGVNNENRLKIPTNTVGVYPTPRLLVKGRLTSKMDECHRHTSKASAVRTPRSCHPRRRAENNIIYSNKDGRVPQHKHSPPHSYNFHCE